MGICQIGRLLLDLTKIKMLNASFAMSSYFLFAFYELPSLFSFIDIFNSFSNCFGLILLVQNCFLGFFFFFKQMWLYFFKVKRSHSVVIDLLVGHLPSGTYSNPFFFKFLLWSSVETFDSMSSDTFENG